MRPARASGSAAFGARTDAGALPAPNIALMPRHLTISSTGTSCDGYVLNALPPIDEPVTGSGNEDLWNGTDDAPPAEQPQ